MLDDGSVVHRCVKAIVEILVLRISFGGGNPFVTRRLLSAPIGRPGHVGPDRFVNSGRSLIAELRQVGRRKKQARMTKASVWLGGEAYLGGGKRCQQDMRSAQRCPFHVAMLFDLHELWSSRGLQIRKQVAEFLRRKLFQKSLGHQRDFGLAELVDFISRNLRTLIVGIDDRDRCSVLLGHYARQHAARCGDDDVVHKLAADHRAGIDDVAQESGPVGAIGGGEIRADFVAVAEELMADGTILFEEQFARPLDCRCRLAGRC